jgi:plasmid maintenance system antidote protein VapI
LEELIWARKKRIPAEGLRQAVRDSGASQQDVSPSTGVPAPVVSRSLAGKRDLTPRTADKMVAYLG